MQSGAIRKSASASRRRFLLAAGAGGAAVVAMPQVAAAQAVRWRMQSAWSPREIFHQFAVDYAKKVDAMSGGRLKLDVLAGGSVVPPFQMAEAVHSGILDGGHGVAGLRYNKHKASALFATPPSFGWDSQGFLSWFYYGGGEALHAELLNGILKLNVTGLLYFPMPTQPLGWFKKEIGSADDLRGVRYRISGLCAEVFKALGAATINLPSGDIVGAIERGVLDASESNNPSTDVQLGLPNVAKHYMVGGHHRQVEAFEIVFNKTQVRCAVGRAQGDLAAGGVRGLERPALVRLRALRQGFERDRKARRQDRQGQPGAARRAAQGLGPGDRRALQGAILRQGDRLAEGLGQNAPARSCKPTISTAAPCRPPTGIISDRAAGFEKKAPPDRGGALFWRCGRRRFRPRAAARRASP